MKKLNLIMMLSIISYQAIAGPKEIPPLARSEEGQRVYAEVSKLAAANDIHGLIQKLPELEPLWKDDPIGYLHAMSINLQPLFLSKDKEAIEAATAVFPRIVEKKCPAQAGLALYCFSLKSGLIGSYAHLTEFRTSPAYYMIWADFLEELHSRRIPDYQNRRVERTTWDIMKEVGVARQSDKPTEAQKDAIQKIIDQNKENDNMDRLQESIPLKNKNIVNWLIYNAPSVNLPEAEKLRFYDELSKRANFTAEERQRLKTDERQQENNR